MAPVKEEEIRIARFTRQHNEKIRFLKEPVFCPLTLERIGKNALLIEEPVVFD